MTDAQKIDTTAKVKLWSGTGSVQKHGEWGKPVWEVHYVVQHMGGDDKVLAEQSLLYNYLSVFPKANPFAVKVQVKLLGRFTHPLPPFTEETHR